MLSDKIETKNIDFHLSTQSVSEMSYKTDNMNYVGIEIYLKRSILV